MSEKYMFRTLHEEIKDFKYFDSMDRLMNVVGEKEIAT